MIHLHYFDELGTTINYKVEDLEAVHAVADALLKAPIKIDCLYYRQDNVVGVFNLETFQVA